MRKTLPWIIPAAIAATILFVGLTTDANPKTASRPIVYQASTESTLWSSATTTAAPATTTTTTAVHTSVAGSSATHKATTTTAFTAEHNDMADRDVIRPTPLAVAQSLVGTVPSYASKGFWCALAVDDYATQAHVPGWTFEDGPRELFNGALAGNRIHPDPHVGDMVFIDLRDPASKAQSDIPDVQVMHVEIVETVNGNEIGDIGGNVGGDNTIKRVTRHVNDGMVIAFGSFPE